eukprot:gene9327-biopygen4591
MPKAISCYGHGGNRSLVTPPLANCAILASEGGGFTNDMECNYCCSVSRRDQGNEPITPTAALPAAGRIPPPLRPTAHLSQPAVVPRIPVPPGQFPATVQPNWME